MKIATLFAALFLAMPAWAARPFVTDDARLTTAGSCQLESWTRQYEGGSEFWALPACNPTGNLEITLGGGRANYKDAGTTDDYVLQFKTLFKPLTRDGWGWGLAVGRVEHPEIAPGPNQLGNTYVYLPFSASFGQDRLHLHANVGWLRDKASRQDRNSWGLGGEFYPHPRLAVLAESFGDDKTRPYWQSGFRYSVVPNLFQLDATAGQQYGGDTVSRWLSIGLRWTPERLF